MAVVFTIPGDDTQYRYPESPRDVTLGQYLDYLEHVEPTRPDVMNDISTVVSEAAPHVRELNEYLDRAGLEPVDNLDQVAGACDGYISSDGATNKGRRIIPMLRDALLPLAERRRKALDSVTRTEYVKFLGYYARVVSHFTGLEYETIIGAREGRHMSYKQVEALYSKIMDAIDASGYVPDESGVYEFQGTRYVLPEKFMKNSTVIEFAESAQYQAHMNEVKNGDWKSLLDVCAVLLRPEGAKYDEEGYSTRKELFKQLPMSTALDVAFFLIRSKGLLDSSFLIYIQARTLARLKQGLTPLQKDTAGT